MRNSDYKDDQFVFRFINSDRCRTIRGFLDFLKINNLPVRERWVFYLFGKFDLFDESSISAMEDKDSFGGFHNGEVYFWSLYLKDERKQMKMIRDDMTRQFNDYRTRIKDLELEIDELEHNIKVLECYTKDNLPRSFSGEGLLIQNNLKLNDLKSELELLNSKKLDNVSLSSEIQKKFIMDGYNYVSSAIDNYYDELESKSIFDYRHEDTEFVNLNSSFCETCQESPCRCSDPDPN